MFKIAIEHSSSCNTFFLIYCKNITNFLFWILWICVTISIFLTFLKYCKDLQTFYFEYFENASSCSSIIIVAPCSTLWYPKCWNLLVDHTLMFKLQATLIPVCKKSTNFFFEILWRYCKPATLGTLEMLDHPHQNHGINLVSSFLRYHREIAHFFFLGGGRGGFDHTHLKW